MRSYLHDRSRTLAAHGIVRRLRLLSRCIEQVYSLIDPADDNPTKDEITDAAIFLQAFIINAFGAIDNLARLWVWEKGVLTEKGRPVPPSRIGLTPDHTLVCGTLSQDFRNTWRAPARGSSTSKTTDML